MFEHFWPHLDGFWHRRDKHDEPSRAHPTSTLELEDDVRCWNWGEYIESHSEVCPYCGHSPDPAIEEFTKKADFQG